MPHLIYKLKPYTSPNRQIFSNNHATLDAETLFLKETIDQLTSACKEKNMNSVKNSLYDIVRVCYTISTIFNVSIDDCFDEVFRSNMTKVCASEEEAKETVGWYKQNELRYKDPSYRESSGNKYWVVYDAATSKILKSIKFELPKLAEVVGL